jgi:hypothetical protein
MAKHSARPEQKGNCPKNAQAEWLVPMAARFQRTGESGFQPRGNIPW